MAGFRAVRGKREEGRGKREEGRGKREDRLAPGLGASKAFFSLPMTLVQVEENRAERRSDKAEGRRESGVYELLNEHLLETTFQHSMIKCRPVFR
ncbi:hypothetical protein DKQ62_03955 [Halomonas elongata]|nr:hypothetical protein DKQ62_03955 [Halomonas elongata]